MPKLWNDTIQAHRHEVREAILDAAASLVADHGLLSLTMSQVAEQTGIGRATLYKYFPDAEAILISWHARHVTAHLQQLAEIHRQHEDPRTRLEAILEAYAQIVHTRAQHGADLSALLHHNEHVTTAQHQVHDLVRDVLAEAMTASHIRDDIAPDELAAYCLHALTAAADLPDDTAVHRLVTLTLSGLQPPLVTGTSRRAQQS